MLNVIINKLNFVENSCLEKMKSKYVADIYFDHIHLEKYMFDDVNDIQKKINKNSMSCLMNEILFEDSIISNEDEISYILSASEFENYENSKDYIDKNIPNVYIQSNSITDENHLNILFNLFNDLNSKKLPEKTNEKISIDPIIYEKIKLIADETGDNDSELIDKYFKGDLLIFKNEIDATVFAIENTDLNYNTLIEALNGNVELGHFNNSLDVIPIALFVLNNIIGFGSIIGEDDYVIYYDKQSIKDGDLN